MGGVRDYTEQIELYKTVFDACTNGDVEQFKEAMANIKKSQSEKILDEKELKNTYESWDNEDEDFYSISPKKDDGKKHHDKIEWDSNFTRSILDSWILKNKQGSFFKLSKTPNTESLLMSAVNSGCMEIVRILVEEENANVNQASNGCLPCEKALKEGHDDIADFLKKHGALDKFEESEESDDEELLARIRNLDL